MIKIRRLIIFILLPALVIPAGAADVRDLLLTTTGLTESDIKSAPLHHPESIFFDLYALAVSGTERLAIEEKTPSRPIIGCGRRSARFCRRYH